MKAARRMALLSAFAASFFAMSGAKDAGSGAGKFLAVGPAESDGIQGPYLGQEPPGTESRVFAPGIVSTPANNEFCASFSPDGKEFYFNRGMTIMVCRLGEAGWTAPEPAPFSRGFRSHEAHLAFDNKRLFFGGSRPPQPYGIWLTERTAAGWSEPRRMWDGMYATSAMNGNVYFGVEGPSGGGIVCVNLIDGRFTGPVAQKIGFGNSTPQPPSIFHPGIAPDEGFIVFDDNKGLYVSFRENGGSWGEAVSLGEILKEREATIPSVSPDGRYLFYASQGDVYWISAKILETLRTPKAALRPSAPAQEIFDAIRRGDAARVRVLVKGDPSLVDARNARRSTPLHVAVDQDNLPLARYFVEKGADPNAVNHINWTPLFYARGVGMAALLLEYGAKIDFIAGDISPLIQLIYAERKDLADYLLSKGASIPAPKTPLGLLTTIRALRIGSLAYFERCHREGLDPHHESQGGSLWLHYAAESPSSELIERLIGLKVPVDRANVFGFTPLHVAASCGNTAVVKVLIEEGADPNARTSDGKTPFNLAAEAEGKETVELLKSLGADQGPPRFPSLTGPYMGQPLPGRKAVLFAPGIVSGRHTYHSSITATPDGNELFWSVGGGRNITIYRVKSVGGRWTSPEVFAQGDAPVVSPDGKKLFFVRWTEVQGNERELIFVSERIPSGWSEPRALPEVINSLPNIHWGVSEDRRGTLYFSAGDRIRYSVFKNGRYAESVVLERLKDVNTYAPFVSPDGSFLLANKEDEGERPIILFRKKDGSWTEPIDLAETIGAENGFCPVITHDGRYLFFLSMLDGVYVPYWMDASFIEELRKNTCGEDESLF